MKKNITSNWRPHLCALSVFLIATPPLTRAATVIDHVPYTITASGEYVLQSNLTANATFGIRVQADNVVIDLKGFTLTQSPSFPSDGIEVSATNVIVRNGTISGFEYGVNLKNPQGKAEDLRLLSNTAAGVGVGADDNAVVNCFIIGTTDPHCDGILIYAGNSNLVKNNQVSDCANAAILSVFSAPGSAFIQNYVAHSATGLQLNANDYYQGNVATNCTHPFGGGNAIGTENGGD